MYFPETGKVTRHRVMKFAKPNRCVSEQQTQTDDVLHDDDDNFTQGDNSCDRVLKLAKPNRCTC